MWTCISCKEEVEDSFDLCWKCGSTRDGVKDPEFGKEAPPAEPVRKPIPCLRCGRDLTYAGVHVFRQPPLSWIGKEHVQRNTFDLYYCTQCGKVELYIAGIAGE